MTEGMSAFNKALEICRLLNEFEFTEEELDEAQNHVGRADTTHGLLWGNIANFHNEMRGLDLLTFLVDVVKATTQLQEHEQFPIAVVAANLKKTQEVQPI